MKPCGSDESRLELNDEQRHRKAKQEGDEWACSEYAWGLGEEESWTWWRESGYRQYWEGCRALGWWRVHRVSLCVAWGRLPPFVQIYRRWWAGSEMGTIRICDQGRDGFWHKNGSRGKVEKRTQIQVIIKRLNWKDLRYIWHCSEFTWDPVGATQVPGSMKPAEAPHFCRWQWGDPYPLTHKLHCSQHPWMPTHPLLPDSCLSLSPPPVGSWWFLCLFMWY